MNRGESFHLACRLNPLPYAEVANDPCNAQTGNQVPIQRANVINTGGNSQHSSPGAHTNKTNCISFLSMLELRSLVPSVTTMYFFKRGKSGKSGVKKNTRGWIFGTQGRLRTWPNKKALTPRTQWQERWCSHGDWWSYSPSEMPYRNLEWKKDKNTFNPVKKSKLSLKVSKLHTGKRNNATTETEEWNGGGAFARFS